jgi:hypothetical protein
MSYMPTKQLLNISYENQELNGELLLHIFNITEHQILMRNWQNSRKNRQKH